MEKYFWYSGKMALEISRQKSLGKCLIGCQAEEYTFRTSNKNFDLRVEYKDAVYLGKGVAV